MGEAPDLREQGDCPSPEACDQSCDQHENERMLTEVYVVQWSNEPMPKEQWSGDHFWPFVEVHTDYGQALRRYGALRDEGMPASLKVTQVIPPGMTGGQA